MLQGSTLYFEHDPVLTAWAAVGGKKEAEGPLGSQFDEIFSDTTMQTEAWEKAETLYQQKCCEHILEKAHQKYKNIDLLLAGDLQAQCTASAYHARETAIPYLGQYGACSTLAQCIGLGGILCAGRFAEKVLALTSSHFCTAERQFRTPLDYGGQRTPTAQWTVTAAGGCLIEPRGSGPRLHRITFGRIQDYEITDINNMGAAMAPAAADTLLRFFCDTQTSPADFDCIYTGDLGAVGSELLHTLLQQEQLSLSNHQDCGLLIYDRKQDPEIKSGGSGAGCSAAVLAAEILPKMQTGSLRHILLLCTGALMSQTTFLQKESIPAVAHLIELVAP